VALSLVDRIPARVAAHFATDSAAARLLRPLVNTIVPGQASTVTIRSGHAAGAKIEIEPKIEKYYWTGSYEPAVQDAISRLLSPGGSMWDVGASIGFHTIVASRAVGPDGQVAAFEPLAANLARLRRSIELNAMSNVLVRPVAVSDTCGTAIFFRAPSAAMGSLVAPAASLGEHTVPTTTLDQELKSLREPSLVKIDVEGGELSVLRGATELLSRVRPVLIVELLTADRVVEVRTVVPWYQFQSLDAVNFIGRAI
jgi:FkbM family methyltransferase